MFYSEHENYANGWYVGYGIYFVGSLATGLGAIGKGVSEVGELAQRFSRAANNLDDVRPSVRAMADGGTSQKTVQVSQRIVADGGSPHIDAPAVRGSLNERGLPAGVINRGMNRLDGIDARHLESLSPAGQATLATRLARSSDPDGTVTFLNRLEETSDVQRVLDEDLATTDRMVNLHENRHRSDGGVGKLRYRHVDPELEANDFVHVMRNGDMEEVQLVVRGSDQYQQQRVTWLETGDTAVGMRKIMEKHGDDFLAQAGTSDPNEIKGLIYRTIRESDEITQNPGGGARYYKEFDDVGEPVRVATGSNGYTLSAHPDGDAPVGNIYLQRDTQAIQPLA